MEQKHNPLLLGVIFLGIIAFIGITSFGTDPAATQSTDSINYRANVCVTHTNSDGQIISSECNHNVLYTTGKELIEAYLGDTGGSGDEVDQIFLCNATAGCGTPVAASTEAFNAYSTCGLSGATGTYTSLGTGNWSIVKTFTATANNCITNSTQLRNSAGVEFAGNAFTTVTLQANDQLTINWTISVS